MSFCYSFRKQDLSLHALLGIINKNGKSPEIALHSFESRSDQYLAARFALEAMNLGETLEKDGSGVITATDLSAESLESAYRE